MGFYHFTLHSLLLFLIHLIFTNNAKSITLNPHLLNSDSGNREKFIIKISPSTDEKETYDDPLKTLIAERFRRSVGKDKISPKQVKNLLKTNYFIIISYHVRDNQHPNST